MAVVKKLNSSYTFSDAQDAPSNEVKSQPQSIPKDAWDKGVLFRSTIHSWIAGKNTALVTIPETETTEPAYWLTGALFSGVLGLRTHFQPDAGSEVLVLRSTNKGENFIIGSLPHATGDAGAMSDQDTDLITDTPAGAVSNPSTGRQQKGDPTSRLDRAGGEFDMMNAQGVGVSFLQNLVRLRASELSSIECHVMDDLVRVISDNFQHVNAFGDFTIRNDGGRPTVTWKGSSKLHETEGRADPNAELEDPEDWLETKAKQRFQSYVGHLGNMVHVFITEPTDALNKTAAGRFRAHVNEDGSFLMQSFGDIAFEKTFAVQVPIQKYREEDPEGDHLADLEYMPHPALQDWIPGDDEFFYESFKLRDYARWLNNWYSLAQYHRSKKDYRVPTEGENKDALSKDLSGDPERPNQGLTDAHEFYLNVYSTIRIFKDGSILLYDGYSSSVHMAGGHVSISAAKNLKLEAAGDVSISAGRDMTIKAYKNFDLLAATGGITMRAKRWFRALAERAEMVVESLATQTTLTEEGTGASHAVTVRSAYDKVRILSLSEVIISALESILLKSTGILARCSAGLRMESIDGESNVAPYFAATPGGMAAMSGRFDNQVDCSQVRVGTPLPIRNSGGISGVQDAEDNVQLPQALYETLNGVLSASTATLAESSNFPMGSATFKHHNEFVTDENFRSITQTTLMADAPPTLGDVTYQQFNGSELDFQLGEGSFPPGAEATEKVYKANNAGMHQPSTTNEHPNSSPSNMVDKAWGFRRIDTP